MRCLRSSSLLEAFLLIALLSAPFPSSPSLFLDLLFPVRFFAEPISTWTLLLL